MIVIGFQDPYRVVGWTYKECLKELAPDPFVDGRRVQEIINGERQHALLVQAKGQWIVLRNAIRTARKLVEKNDWRLVKVEVESMRQAILPWVASQDMLCRWILTTSPSDVLYEGPQSLTCQYGMIYVQGGGPVPFAAANHGDTDRLHLLLTLRREAEE